MASESASIFEVIKRGGWDGSLFTTFNATLPFYEDVVLRKLTAVGCRNNVLLMDRRQCALAYASEATRPRMAGIAYTLIPVQVSGAFHPKLAMFAGKKRATVLVGSHNLTISGFGYNREVTNHIDMVGAPGTAERNLLVKSWMTARAWIEELGADLPSSLLESAYALDGPFGAGAVDDRDTAIHLLEQRPGVPALLDQLAVLIPGEIRRITVLGAFFDRDGKFLLELAGRWEGAEIIVGVDPATVCMPTLPVVSRLRLVDASNIGDQKNPGYLHAKAIYFEGEGSTRLLATGSANPSAPAWLSGHSTTNVEAMLVQTGVEARTGARRLGLERLAKEPAVIATVVAEIQSRSRVAQKDEPRACPPVFVGIADYESDRVLISGGTLPVFDAIEALGPGGTRLSGPNDYVASSSEISLEHGVTGVSSMELRMGSNVVARVLVHHPTKISQLVHRTSRESASQLLWQLGSSTDDISRVLPFIEKLIFSDTIYDAVRLPAGRPAGEEQSMLAVARPESLRVSLREHRRLSRPSLFFNPNDLASLIDILLRRIDINVELRDRGIDREGRSEEEQVGQDDLGPSLDVAGVAGDDSNDAEIADAVCQKATKLMRRMTKALWAADESPAATMVLVAQLLGVIALLRELVHLELTDRWRQAHAVFVDVDELGEVLDAASAVLLANGSEALTALSDESGIVPEEVGQLRSLLLWLAWMTGCEWWTPRSNRLADEEDEERVFVNGQLLELLRNSHGASEGWLMLEQSISHTLPPDPITAAASESWLQRHRSIGSQIAAFTSSSPVAVNADSSIVMGDLVRVPGSIDFLAVAAGNNGRMVAVHVGLEKPRSFLISHVELVGRT